LDNNKPQVRTLVACHVLLFFLSSSALAYHEDYPPYDFKDGPPAHLQAEDVFKGRSIYRSEDRNVIAGYKADEINGTNIFRFRVGGKIRLERGLSSIAIPALYKADLDKNGQDDYIAISWGGGTGLGALVQLVDLFLARTDGQFDVVSYESFAAGLEDFVDPDGDGRYEMLVTDMYWGRQHNYFAYSIYQIRDGKLLNANARFKGFPKFIWYTRKRNDQDTSHLSPFEREGFVRRMDSKVTGLRNA
jgi:hypothetical protein